MDKTGKVIKAKYCGIVVVGDTKEAAIESYRCAATGKSAKAYRSECNSFVFVSSANDNIRPMNPYTGQSDIVQADRLVQQLKFASESSNVQAHHLMCSTCGSHTVADSAEFAKHCIVCSSEVSDLETEALAEGFVGTIVAGATLEEAKNLFIKASSEGRGYKDKAGIVQFLSMSGSEYNPFTGLQDIVQDTTKHVLESTSSDKVQAHYYVCASSTCARHVLSTSEAVVFCPSCSSGLLEPEFDELGDEDEELMLDDSEAEDEQFSDEMKTECKGDDEEESDSEEEDDVTLDLSDEAEEEDVDEESEESEGDDSEGDDSEGDESEDSGEDFDLDQELAALDEEEELEDEEESDEELESESKAKPVKMKAQSNAKNSVKVKTKPVKFNLMRAVCGSAPLAEDFSVAHCGQINGKTTWTMFYQGTPIGVATSLSAAKHHEVFDTPTYGRAVAAAIKELGATEAMAEMGFTQIEQSVNVEQHLADQVEQQVQQKLGEVTAAAKASADQFVDRFISALSIAAVGINRNFFKGLANPTKNALISSLSAAGVRDAGTLVDRVYQVNQDQYNKMLVAKASEICQKPIEIQNQLADAVADTNVEYAAESSSVSSVEDRLENFGTTVIKSQQIESTSKAQDIASTRLSVVRNLGRRPF